MQEHSKDGAGELEALEPLVARAVEGDGRALDTLIRAIKDDIYGLAMRMLWHPADAEDATQEVLVRVCTALDSFEGRSRFRTWVYRVAVRSLLNFKRGRVEPPTLSFEDFRSDLLDGLTAEAPANLEGPEAVLLKREVKIGCTQAMLLCLDRDHRIAYLLAEIAGLSNAEAAACMDIPEATYRKRLSRGRAKVRAFMSSTCGLVSEDNPCRCVGRIGPALSAGRVDPKALLFAEHAVVDASRADAAGVVGALKLLSEEVRVLRSNPNYLAPDGVMRGLRELVR